jgi:hypothetical protein
MQIYDRIYINSISNVKNTVNLQLQDPKKTGIRLVSPNSRIDLAANKATSVFVLARQ